MTDAALALDRHAPLLMPSRIERAGPGEIQPAPACPLCGASTVRRPARSDPRAGSDFWGCVDIGGPPAMASRLPAFATPFRAPVAGAPAIATLPLAGGTAAVPRVVRH